MSKINSIILTLLITVFGVPGLPYLNNDIKAVAEEKQELAKNNVLEDIRNTIFNNKPPVKRQPGGSRGFSICLISPDKIVNPNYGEVNNQENWSDRPLFNWQIQKGKVKTIEVHSQGNEKILWSQEIDEGETTVIYNGVQPLEAGKSYELRMTILAPFPVTTTISEFQIMDSEKRKKITDDLNLLEANLKQKGANEEEIALEKANYFAKQELWSDVLRELYSVPNPSGDLMETIEKIQEHDFCAEDESNNSQFQYL
ncbi:MAG: hypothetical protein F6K10_22030 [Moorea sp. SIO2B7]|nr:hypothetical protein [Moorena sp. SIO2B7]